MNFVVFQENQVQEFIDEPWKAGNSFPPHDALSDCRQHVRNGRHFKTLVLIGN